MHTAARVSVERGSIPREKGSFSSYLVRDWKGLVRVFGDK